ncbi:polyadenylate-binding protein-interacting protein 4 isoform X6 [Brassica napus]|uniref:polyadenylate-binding protein-interacting protein 4 isoform X6 n=1 Tax=Brassica napus TaxID=3708 RepID=UPI002078AC7D|nr:polyadenylate-binding protein-interacting protein 4 isoform X6 [Brassica napus]XP_048632385.1 polyadenylate-binding protein-interacting protein 4 isoform X6 [Brassica napus]XP_048632386.1 polyadenylate-binding protein-interacting protein 4 isoform X6 [Brassica napus]
MMTSFKVAKWNLEKLLLYTSSGEPVKKMLCVWNIDIKEGGGGTSASKTVAENERQVSQISGETKSESAFGQSDSRRISESGPATPTSTRPGLSPSSPISSLPSSEKSTLNPNAKFEQFKATMNVEDGSLKRRSRDSLVYLTTCMIGHLVEAYLKNGSVYSGIFHAAHVEKDFGIVLKMASLVKDGTLRGHKSRSEFVRKPPYKTFIITGDELVQVVAKDLSVISDGKLKAVQSEKSVELLTDSSISKSCRFDQGRELKHWVPDGQAPEGLDNVFDKPWKRGGWDQFKVNQERFGVMSTFNEEMYTTPLDRGLWTRELEEKAREIAREIEGENTGDLHVAEERGLQVNEKFDTDEEAKYSAVRRVDGFDDSGFDEEDDKLLDTCNDQTFGGSSTSIVQKPASSSGQKPTSSSGKGYGGESCSISDDHAGHLPSEQRSKYFPARGSSISESQLGERRNNNNPEVARSNRTPEKSVSGSGHGDIKEGGGGTSASKTVAENERQVSQISGETKSESAFGQSDSRRISESGPATPTSTRPGLSPSSPISSLPSPEKSTLNPNAKFEQFKATMNVEDGSLKRRSRDSLVYLTTCMIGHLVEAYLKNGSVYSGIFHAAHVEKDFGIVLKMASLVKDGTLRGHKSRSEFVRKPPYKTFIITGDELVQVVAKDLSVFSDGKLKAVQSEKSVELLTDSSISKSCRVDQGRELKHWVPDGQAPEGLDNVFDKPWKRGGWDQFKVNQERFGVMSTFNEEMYTTPLDRGLWTRELEEKAREIAREIEGENTGDLHVAEERGLQVNEKFDTDEEAKYSAVRRVDGFDDSGFDEEDDKLLDTCNDQTFGGSSTSIVQKPASSGGQKPTSSSGKGYGGESCSISDDHAGHLPSEQRSKYFPARGSSISESQLGERRNNNNPEVARSNRSPEVSVSGHGDIEEGANLGGGGTSSASMTVAEKERQVNQVSGERKSESSFGQSASRRGSESGPAPSASTRPGLSSPSSSISSLPSSEKSILNPNAKEFKPSQSPAPVRPQSPIAGGSFYYAAPPPPVQQMPVMPAGYGHMQIQPQYPGQQQLLRYPGHEYPQTYYPPNAPPQYQQWQQLMMQGQELMMQGQYPRPPDMIYMPLPPPYQPGNPHNQG